MRVERKVYQVLCGSWLCKQRGEYAYVAVTDSHQSALRAPLRYRGHPCPSLERGLWLAGQPDGWTSQSAVLTVGRGRGGGAQGTRATLAGAVPLQVDTYTIIIKNLGDRGFTTFTLVHVVF